MKSIKLDKIWEENKKFLLGTGGVVVVFLFLLSTIANYRAEALVYVNRYYKNRTEMEQLYERVRDHYHESGHRLSDFESLERGLLKDYGPPVSDSDFKAINDFGIELYFEKQLGDIWRELDVKKTKRSINCEYKKITSSALGVSSDDTNEDVLRNQKYVEVLQRGLHMLLESGMTKIHAPRVSPEDANGIRDNPGHEAVFQRISIEAEGPFRSFARVFEAAQALEAEKKGGVQVLLLQLGPGKRAKNTTRTLRGRFEFRAFSIEEARADRERSKKRRGKRVGRRR